ncbi:hypothetical protein CTAYLR_007306 [Chrysophaeum taylorii]|uniref:SHOCT domain-containing protein n=1 Tax=Chrysophaeum taylorii TaxID=2483200 RepID=A0AAD7UJK7_9STRA|nr:hypothetical protein CTAYLR_007306 [Chrysophaeum taylorii]
MDPQTAKQLREAKALLDEGVLTEEEFKTTKAEILDKAKQRNSVEPALKKPKTGLVLEDCGAEGVLVSGDTWKAKDLLRQLGGTWSKGVGAWVLSAGTADSVATGLETAGFGVERKTGNLAARTEALEASKAEAVAKTNAAATLQVEPHKRAIIVKGETRKVSDALKALGGKWNRTLGGWVFSQKQQHRVVEVLKADPTNTVTLDDALDSATSAAEKKTDHPATAELKSKHQSVASTKRHHDEDEAQPKEDA